MWEESKGYVCDGMFMGGPSRFINHSCEPNCRIITASYNHADVNIYDLAFFATESIPAMTELTFDYGEDIGDDRDDGEDDVEKSRKITAEKAAEMAKEKGYRPARCLCGTRSCRGYFFTWGQQRATDGWKGQRCHGTKPNVNTSLNRSIMIKKFDILLR